MAALDPSQAQSEEQEDHKDLEVELAKSDKLKLEREETESIASALEGPVSASSDPQDAFADLEKASTRVSRSSHEPATRIVTAVDWNGPNDPENPLTWPVWKKAYHILAIGTLAFAVTAGSSIITPGTLQIAEDFQISRTVAILPLTVFVLGLAFGPVIAAPISETYGRSVVYKVSAPLYMLFLVGAGFSKSLGSLLVCRLLAGTIGGPVLAVGAGSNADMFPVHNRAVATSFFIMMPFLGPSLGPVIGGFAAQFKGWRWTQWCTIFIGLAALVLVLPMNETYKKVILMKRAKKHNVEGPPKPPVKGMAYVKLLVTVTLVRPVHMLFTEPIVLFFSLYNSFTFSVRTAMHQRLLVIVTDIVVGPICILCCVPIHFRDGVWLQSLAIRPRIPRHFNGSILGISNWHFDRPHYILQEV